MQEIPRSEARNGIQASRRNGEERRRGATLRGSTLTWELGIGPPVSLSQWFWYSRGSEWLVAAPSPVGELRSLLQAPGIPELEGHKKTPRLLLSEPPE